MIRWKKFEKIVDKIAFLIKNSLLEREFESIPYKIFSDVLTIKIFSRKHILSGFSGLIKKLFDSSSYFKEKLNTFLKDKFKSGVEFYDNIRRNVWRGFKLKPLTFSVNDHDNITDYERFILDKCQINYLNRISYTDFFDEFVNYKKIENPGYILDYKDKQKIQNYLTDKLHHLY